MTSKIPSKNLYTSISRVRKKKMPALISGALASQNGAQLIFGFNEIKRVRKKIGIFS